jgi:hypothetical protein
MTMKKHLFFAVACALLPGASFADEAAFGKDRRAILAMAGEFEVGFHFQETLSLKEGYEVRKKPYDEDAFETVKVVEDSGRRIVLQHLLLVGPMVVKHWAQIWTYEDAEILEFQGKRVWATRVLAPDEVKGKWSQRVTQVDDSPRYEGIGAWIHNGQSSEWSATANRPLPRREHTTRKDYDLLVVTNRHTITPAGWFHEQDNTKWVKRDGADYPLCREVGLNPYRRVQGHDFTRANDYWTKTAGFWKEVRGVWEEITPREGSVKFSLKAESGRLDDVIGELTEQAEDGKAPGVEEIRAALKPFVAAVK